MESPCKHRGTYCVCVSKPVYLQSTRSPSHFLHLSDRVFTFVSLPECIFSYLHQFTNYTGEWHSTTGFPLQINTYHIHSLTNVQTHTETSVTGQRHQALHFLFRPLCTLGFLSGLPNTQPSVTIATSQRATSSQADHVTATSVRGRRRTPPNLLTAYNSSLNVFAHRPERQKISIPLLMFHPWHWSLKVVARREKKQICLDNSILIRKYIPSGALSVLPAKIVC